MVLNQVPFNLLLLPWILEYARYCVCPLRVESISRSFLGLLKVSPTVLQSQMFWGLVFLMQDPRAGEPNVELRPLAPLGERLQL